MLISNFSSPFQLHKSLWYCQRLPVCPNTFDTTLGASQSIDTYYGDGLSVTQGSPRKHLWAYANGLSELHSNNHWHCPCSQANPNNRTDISNFVGEQNYFETGFPGTTFQHGVVRWDDPLWDGQGCVSTGNRCCERYDWFYLNVPSFSDDIELRSCQDESSPCVDILIGNFDGYHTFSQRSFHGFHLFFPVA